MEACNVMFSSNETLCTCLECERQGPRLLELFEFTGRLKLYVLFFDVTWRRLPGCDVAMKHPYSIVAYHQPPFYRIRNGRTSFTFRLVYGMSSGASIAGPAQHVAVTAGIVALTSEQRYFLKLTQATWASNLVLVSLSGEQWQPVTAKTGEVNVETRS